MFLWFTLLFASLPAHAAWEGSVFMDCYERLMVEPAHPFDFDRARFRKILGREAFNGRELIDFLSENEDLKQLFRAPAGVWQGYTIEGHSLRVFDVLEDQFRYFPAVPPPPGIDWTRLFKIGVALHDIGKPVAMEKLRSKRNRKKSAPSFTVPIAERVLEELNFTSHQRKLLLSLIGHDLIGDAVRERLPLSEVHAQLVGLAEANGMAPLEFFELQVFFFNIDASSYDNVLELLYNRVRGRLVPSKKPQIAQLRRLFQ